MEKSLGRVRCANITCWNEAIDYIAHIPLCESHSETVVAIEDVGPPPDVMIAGLVYYALFEKEGHVKIGHTTQPNIRFKSFRKAYSDRGPFRVIAAEPGGRDKERRRHLQYHSWRVGERGEFFVYSDKIADDLEEMRLANPKWREQAKISDRYT